MARGKKGGADRHVRLHHWLMRTEAWRSLDPVARCAYVELSARKGFDNNGRIPFSVREMAEALGTSKATALRAFARLKERGFVVETKKGAFNRKVRHASEWRLTEFGTEAASIPTKDFVHWTRKNTVSPQHPYGCRDETVRVSR